MVNLKRISSSAFTLLALGVAQRLMAQQPFWLPVLAPELTLADQPATIADGNSLFLNSTEDKLELHFSAELNTKRSSDDDSNEVDTNSEAEGLSSNDGQQEKNEDIKNELSASSAFDHLGEKAAPAVDIALPYAAGLFASWLMKVDQSMGMLTAKSITAGLAYAGHHLGQTKDNEVEEDSLQDDSYSLTLWFDTPNVSVDEFKNEIKNIIDFNEKNPSLQIDSPLVYARNPYLTGNNPDSNYYKIYLPKNLSEILTDNASRLIPDPGFYFDIGSFQCEKSPDTSKECVPYTSQYAPTIPKIQADLNVWGEKKDGISPIQSAMSWVYDFHQQYNKPFEFVIDPEHEGVTKEVVTNILQYMQDFISSNSNGDSLKDDVKVGVTLGLDQGEQTSLYITGKDNTGKLFSDPIKGNVYIQAYDADWNYWLRGFDRNSDEPISNTAGKDLYDMMKLITCLTTPDDNSECYTNLPIVPLSDSHFGSGDRSYTLKPKGIVYDLTVKGIDIQDFPYIPAYQMICTSFAEADSFIFNFHETSGAQSSPSDVFKATDCNYDQDSLELALGSVKIPPNTEPSKPDNLYFSQVEVDFSGITDESHAKQVKFMFSFDTVSQSYKDEDEKTQSVDIPFFKKVDPSTFNQFLDQFYTSSVNDNKYSIFDSNLKLNKDSFAVYQYSTLLKDDAGWFPSADDADAFSI